MIKLNVGGKIFCIGKSQLLSVQGSYFHAMLGSGLWEPDSDGAYFIDRNSKNFDRVLDYLRTGKFSFLGLRLDQIRMLQETLDYLQIPLCGSVSYPPVTWDPQMCGKGIRLSGGNQVAVSTRWHQSVRSLNPCERFSVRLDSLNSDVDRLEVSIGFATAAGFSPNAPMDKTCGWYIFAVDGELFSQGGHVGESYSSEEIGACSIVTCILDREDNSIRFEVDGTLYGVAYSNIPQVELYVALSFDKLDVQVTLLD